MPTPLDNFICSELPNLLSTKVQAVMWYAHPVSTAILLAHTAQPHYQNGSRLRQCAVVQGRSSGWGWTDNEHMIDAGGGYLAWVHTRRLPPPWDLNLPNGIAAYLAHLTLHST